MTQSDLQTAFGLQRAGKLKEAAEIYRQILRSAPRNFDALHALGLVRYQSGDLVEAERLLAQALNVNPQAVDARLNHALLLFRLGRVDESLQSFNGAIATKPDFVEALVDRGNALAQLRRYEEALADFNRVAELRPGWAFAWGNLGRLLGTMGRPLEALASFGKALKLEPKNPDLLRFRADALFLMKRNSEAAQAYEIYLALKPDDAQAWNNRGVALIESRRPVEALPCFEKAVGLQPKDAEAWSNRGNVLFELKRFDEAAEAYHRALAIEPDLSFVRGFLVQCRLRSCDWRFLDRDRAEIEAGVRAGKPVLDPLGSLFILRSPEDQLRCARISAADGFASLPPPLWKGERYRHDRIRLAYLSADYRPHPVAFLIAGVFEHHDRKRFETIGISFGPGQDSSIHGRIARGFEHFYDVRNKGDLEVASLLRELEVDVAVDLMGFTEHCRTGILSHRPAPVQVNYLGFPGTMGAPHIDYLLGDRIVIPEADRKFYSEQIVYLPDAYQANDSKREIASRSFTRTELGLPDDGFVFCCFNNNFKITDEFFAVWMRLLAQNQRSVLWLLMDNPSVVRNLRERASASGIAPERLVFAPRTTPAEHLARQQAADLFLDTLPYSAHTTASDALFVGLPLVTCLGTTFAGRVAASLLTAVGLPELITRSLDEYEALATRLARNPTELRSIREKLAANGKTYPLFDTTRMTRNLENAFAAMWERSQRGQPPAGFAVDPAVQPR
ncbi:MAG TPA: tetratricopeptide repeat protein [Micropepsaceae bacterium]|nr:tetratricopeptide repeat protein [Micropepsaceae bacterium]